MSERTTLRCKAVLFDMDGTLVDSTRIVERAWGGWAGRHGIAVEEVLKFSHGRPTISTLEHFLPGEDHTAELEELALFEEVETDGIVAVPGALDAVRALETARIPWAIVTSAWRKLAEIRVLAAGLPLPQVLVPVDEIRHGKPDPEGYRMAAVKLGVDAADCLVFEDTRPGIEAGLRAGMQVVGLLTTCPAHQLRHAVLAEDFRKIAFIAGGDWLEVSVSAEDREG